MAITEADLVWFREEYVKIKGRYPSPLSDKERFKELCADQDFVEENACLFQVIVDAWTQANTDPESFPSDGLKVLLEGIAEFAERWETPPINPWLTPGAVRPRTREEMEALFDHAGLTCEIKVYPWTTKQNVMQAFERIREEQKVLRLNRELWPSIFQIHGLREAGWSWREILPFVEGSEAYLEGYEQRQQELEQEGRSEEEIDRILDQEFPMEEYDKMVNGLKYDTVRMRARKAERLIQELLSVFQVKCKS